jgi:hypothetical protein
MASEVINNVGDPLLVVAGNLHTRLQELYLDNEFPNFQPMGSIIKKNFPEVMTIKIDYGSGSFMNMHI